MSDFQRIKRAIDLEKQKKIQAETKIEGLKQEKERLMNEVETLLQHRPNSLTELSTIIETKKQEIETAILKLKQILDEEGVSY